MKNVIDPVLNDSWCVVVEYVNMCNVKSQECTNVNLSWPGARRVGENSVGNMHFHHVRSITVHETCMELRCMERV